MSSPERIYRGSVRLFSLVFAALGLVLLVSTFAGDHANLPRSDHQNSPGMSASTAPAA